MTAQLRVEQLGTSVRLCFRCCTSLILTFRLNQLSRAQAEQTTLAAQVRSLSSDIVIHQQEVEVEAWRSRVESLLRTHTAAATAVAPVTSPTAASARPEDATIAIAAAEVEAARRDVAALAQEMRAVAAQLTSASSAAGSDTSTELRLLLRQHELEKRQDAAAARLGNAEVPRGLS